MKNLTQILDQINGIEMLLIESGGEINEATEIALQESSRELMKKVDSYKFVVDSLESRAEFYKQKAVEFSTYQKRIESHTTYLKEHLKEVMVKEGMDKFDGEEWSVKLQKTQKVNITGEESVPNEYKTTKITVSPDKKKLAEDLKNGLLISGAELVDSFFIKFFPRSLK